MLIDSLKAIHFVKHNPRIIDVDYKNGKRKFKTFSSSDGLNGKLTKMDIEDK